MQHLPQALCIRRPLRMHYDCSAVDDVVAYAHDFIEDLYAAGYYFINIVVENPSAQKLQKNIPKKIVNNNISLFFNQRQCIVRDRCAYVGLGRGETST